MLFRPHRPISVSCFGKALLFVAICASLGACSAGGAPPAAAASPEPPGAAVPAPSEDQHHRGGASVFVVHEMSDFDAFQKFFEEGAPEREKAGVKGYLLSRLDDGRVVIHFFADELRVVDEALKSPKLQEYLGRKGAPEASLVWITRDVYVTVPAAPPTGETYSLYLKLKVGDFAALERGFAARAPVFAEQGVIGRGLHQSTTSEEIAILHFMGTARDKLEALLKRKEFVELLSQAKSQGEVKGLIGVDRARHRAR